MKILVLGAALMGAIALCAGCVTRPKPVIQTVCVEIVGLPAHEVEFLLKHTQSDLAEYGMVQSSTGECDVRAKYQPFGNFQAEQIGPLSKAGYWSQEGNVTVTTRDGGIVAEDQEINLRGYESRQSLLDQLSWKIIEPVTSAFKGPPKSK